MRTLFLVLSVIGFASAADAGTRCVVLGDSIFAGYVTHGEQCASLAQTTKVGSNVAFNVAAVSGSTSATALTLWTSTYRTAGYNCLVLLTGTNDYTNGGGMLAAASISNIGQMVSEARALGMAVYVFQILPRSSDVSYGYSATVQTQIDAINAWIATLTTATPILSYAAMGESGTPSRLAITYDSGDGLHPNTAGQTALKNLLVAAMP